MINKNYKKGSAIVIVLVISTTLLVMALGYSKLTKNVTASTAKIDDHVRLQYLADGLAQIVLLKYKKYPSDFYDAWIAARAGNNDAESALRAFITGKDGANGTGNGAGEFDQSKFLNANDQPISMLSANRKGNSENMIHLSVISVDLRTTVNDRWSEDVLTIVTGASFRDSLQHDISAQSTLTVVVSRQPAL